MKKLSVRSITPTSEEYVSPVSPIPINRRTSTNPVQMSPAPVENKGVKLESSENGFFPQFWT